MTSASPFLYLPQELRDLIYAHIHHAQDTQGYITYQTGWCPLSHRITTHRLFSPWLTTALSLPLTNHQIHSETHTSLCHSLRDPAIHFRLLNRDDAYAWKTTIPRLAHLYPNLSHMIVTLSISGEHTHSLSYLPTSIPHLRTLHLEVMDRLKTKRFFIDAHILAHNRSGGSSVYADRELGALVLRETVFEAGHVFRNVVCEDGWILRFERGE